MGSPYTSTSVSGYNANPPADDGSQVASNKGNWSFVKTKIGDPLNTFAAAVDSNITAAFGKTLSGASVVSTAVDYPAGASDQGRLIVITAAGKTVTTPDAGTVHAPFVFAVINTSVGKASVAPNATASQQINGSTSSAPVAAGQWCLVYTDGTNWFTGIASQLPTWTTANRPASPPTGTMLGYNTTVPQYEYWDGAAWQGLSILVAAVQSDMEAATSTTTVVTPGRLFYHPCVPKSVGLCSIAISAVAGTISSANTGTDIITHSGVHGMSSGQILWIGATPPTGITQNAVYYVGVVTTTTYKVYTTLAGALAVDGTQVDITASVAGASVTTGVVSVSSNFGLATNPFQFTTASTNIAGAITVSTAFSSTNWMPILTWNSTDAPAGGNPPFGAWFQISSKTSTVVNWVAGGGTTLNTLLWNSLNAGKTYYISFQGYGDLP